MRATELLVVDERDRVPVRRRLGRLLSGSVRADFAVGRIRLAALDLTEGEVEGLERCRVLLGHLDAGTLLDVAGEPADPPPTRAAPRLAVLRGFAASGRLEVRSAGLAGWTPDFSIFRPVPGAAEGSVPPCCALGAHYFGAPHPIRGPSFTAFCTDPEIVRLMSTRFEEVWALGHDVLPAIRDVLGRAHALALESAGPGRRGDRAGAAG